MSADIIYPKEHYQYMMLLQIHAPWEIIKGADSSCLCINCEDINAAKREINKVIESINRLRS